MEEGELIEAEENKIAHDNYALKLLRGEISASNELVVEDRVVYDQRKRQLVSQGAPVLRGSCGFSGLGGKAENSTWLGAEGEYFECPRCQGKIQSGKGITVCPHCGMKKEDAGNKCD